MTQYQQFGGSFGEVSGAEAKTSGLAIGSLICSLIFFCPLTTLVAPILGLAAIVSIGNDPLRKGKGLAMIGIILGLLFTIGQGILAYKIFEVGRGYFVFVMAGPQETLAAGYSGDLAAFKSNFEGAGATATDAEAAQFISTLRQRYGEFQSSKFDESSGSPPQGKPGAPSVPFPYVLQFSNSSANAEVELVFADQQSGTMRKKIGYIKIIDPVAGDLTYPPPAGATGNGG